MNAQYRRWWRSLRAARSSASYPLLLTAFVTDRCGLRCRHCLFAEHLNELTERGLRRDDVARIFERWPHLPWGIVTGGEPFLQPNLVHLLEPFLGTQGVCVLTIPTSGRYPDTIRETLSQCGNIFQELPHISVSVSVYGDEALHDEITAVPDSHRLAMEALSQLVSLAAAYSWLIPTLQFTVMHSNERQAPDVLSELARRFPSVRQTVNRVRAPVPDPAELSVSAARLMQAVRRAAAHNRGLARGRLLARLVALRDRLIETDSHVRPGSCAAGRRSLVLGPDGLLRGCEWFYDRPIGDARNSNWSDIDKARDEFHLSAVRRGCSCTHECVRQVSGIDRTLHMPKQSLHYR